MGQERGAKDSRMDRSVHQTWEQERARGRMNTFCPAEPDAYRCLRWQDEGRPGSGGSQVSPRLSGLEHVASFTLGNTRYEGNRLQGAASSDALELAHLI